MEARFNQKRVESESCPFRKFIRRHISKDDAYSSKESSLGASVASTSGNNVDHSMIQEEFVRDESALLSLHPWIFKKESYREGANNGVEKSRGSLRSRRFRRYLVKPVTFTGNYMKPFAEQVEMDEYFLDSPPNSPTPSLRPYVVTDGRRIISKSSFDYFSMRHENPLFKEDGLHEEADTINSVAKRVVTGVPLLPNSGKMKRKCSELQDGRVEASNSANPCKVLQLEDSHERVLPFCIGISIGMICALLLKRTEVDKLNKSLKQAEDLVQDLQEELEMKDSFSVKELTYGIHENRKLKHWNSKSKEPIKLCQEENLTHSASQDECECPNLNRTEEKAELLRKIEVELEAELERLEENMNACSLEQKIVHLELDSDIIADVVHGELRTDNLTGEILENQANSSCNTSSTSTAQTYNVNYSVSPQELSLRLHQVIQSRLEERIVELERELLKSQRQLQVMETERVRPQRTLSNSDIGFSSTHESPRAIQSDSALVHPFCLNLSRDALNAYDEAYEEFMQMDEKRESPPSPTNKGEWIDGYKSSSSGRSFPWENNFWSRGSEEEDGESGSFTDEEGKMLIQQLVEKTKQGYPALINAQKMFLLMDE